MYFKANLYKFIIQDFLYQFRSIEKGVDHQDFHVEIDIASPPSARFFRIVTQTTLDLIGKPDKI